MSDLEIDLVDGGAAVLSGRLDVRTATVARAALQDLVDGGHGEITIDLSQLEIWDRAGLGVVAGIARRARTRRRGLVLLDARPREQRLLGMAGVWRTARPSPSVPEPSDSALIGA